MSRLPWGDLVAMGATLLALALWVWVLVWAG